MKTAAAYARVSTDKQSETSIDTQLDEIHKYAQSQNIEIRDQYIDKITASGKEERPQFNEMIQRAIAGEYQIILVYKQDRFHRDNVEEHTILRMLEANKVYVISVSERIDTTTPTGRLSRWIMSGVNRFYIENLQQEVNAKTTLVAERGYFLGGIPPYGYNVKQIRDPEASRNRKIYEINEEEAAIVRLIFHDYAKGAGYGEIVQKLNAKGIHTRTGNEWTKSTLRDMLVNEKYSGTYTFRRGTKHNYHQNREDMIRAPGKIPAIVDPIIYEHVVTRIRSQKHQNTRGDVASCVNGVVYCGDCGEKMYFHARKPPRYVCGRWERKKDVKCVQMSAMKIESQVIGYIKNELLTDVDYAKLVQQYNEERILADRQYQERLDKIEMERAECDKAITNAIKAIMEGSPLSKELEKTASEKKARLKELELERQKMMTRGSVIITEEAIRKKLEDYLRALDGDTQERRAVVLELIERIDVYPGYIRIQPR